MMTRADIFPGQPAGLGTNLAAPISAPADTGLLDGDPVTADTPDEWADLVDAADMHRELTRSTGSSVRIGGAWFDSDAGEFEPRGGSHRFSPKKKGAKAVHGTTEGPDIRYRDPKTFARDLPLKGATVRVWSPDAEKDQDVMRSLAKLARYPDIYPFVAVMPDFNAGDNSVNGSVIPSLHTIYVNAIGGDVGCGMTSAKLPLTLDDVAEALPAVYRAVYELVPTGKFLQKEVSERVAALPIFATDLDIMNHANKKSALRSFGTLGSGNHFIEIQANVAGEIFVTIHTGSRILGQHIKKAGMQTGLMLERPYGVVALEADSAAGQIYLDNVAYAVAYASANRQEILSRVLEAFGRHVGAIDERAADEVVSNAIDVPHNYIARESHFGREVYVHRKGAMHVPEGKLGVIPGSMGNPSFIVRGKGNPYALDSSSHGAGRTMSRPEAMQKIRMERFLEQMAGILCRHDESVLKEAGDAYRSIEDVMRFQRDLVSIVERLRPLAIIR